MDYGGQPHVLVLAVHMVNLLSWRGQGDYLPTYLLTFLAPTGKEGSKLHELACS